MAKGSAWYKFVRSLVRTLFFGAATGGLKAIGKEHVPASGALIVAPLHVSHLDPPVVACAIPRQLTFMAKEELFKGFFGKIIRSLGAFPVRRGEGDTESIRHSIALLEEGRAVLVFPEGTRGDAVTMGAINRGVAMLAKRTGARVLPVGVIGTHKVMPKGQSKLKRHRITVAFGPTFSYDEIATGGSERENRERFANELESRIAQLCRENGLPLRTAAEAESPETSRSSGRSPESPTPESV